MCKYGISLSLIHFPTNRWWWIIADYVDQWYRSEVRRERHLEEPEILATGEEEQSEDEVMLLFFTIVGKCLC
jgi:hypothetical protein